MTREWFDALPKNACFDAVVWAGTQPTAAAAWKSCERGDWMLWLLGKLSGKPESASRKKLVLAACACARLSLKHVRKGEECPRIAIETAEAWARDEGPTLAQVRQAAHDAASYAAYIVAASYAAHDAASYAAHDAASYAASYAARKATLKECADIVRKHYPQPPRLK